MKGHLSDVMTIQKQAAFIAVVETRDQVDHRSLASTSGTYQSHGLAGLHIQVEVLQDVDRAVIGEGHIVEGDLASDARQLRSSGSIVHCDGLIDHLKDTLQICYSVDEHIVQVGPVQDRLPEPP